MAKSDLLKQPCNKCDNINKQGPHLLVKMKFKDFSRTFKDLFSIFKRTWQLEKSLKIMHLTFILKLKERNAIRKKMTSEKLKLEKINIWAIILGLVIILQLFPAY